MDIPLFSVVIPTYDRPELLEFAVASVAAQTCEDWECLVVDDCGTTPVRDFPDPRVDVLRLPSNRGKPAALNEGVARTRGRFVTTLDDDDEWTPDRLEMALPGLERQPLAFCASRYLDEPGRGHPRLLEGDVSDTILDSMTPNMGSVSIERAQWLPLREDYRSCHDVEWWLRIAQSCPVTTIPQLGHLIRRHAGPRHLNGVDARLRDNTRLIEENRDWFDSHPRGGGVSSPTKRVLRLAPRRSQSLGSIALKIASIAAVPAHLQATDSRHNGPAPRAEDVTRWR